MNGFRFTPQMRKNFIIAITGISGIAMFGVLNTWMAFKLFNLFTVQQLLGGLLLLVTYWFWNSR